MQTIPFRSPARVLLAGLLLLAAPAWCQQRAAVLGIVRDAAGKPVAGADVALLSRPIPSRTDVGEPDLVHARSDADGRFEAEVLDGRGYTAWARCDEPGTAPRLSKPAEHVVPGPVVTLTLGAAGDGAARRIRIRGLEAWKDRAPLSFTAWSSTHDVIVESFEPDAEGIAVLPLLPSGASVVVRDRHGALLHLDGGSRPTKSAGEWVVEIAPPLRVDLAVVDAAGAKVAGARVWHAPQYSMGGWRSGMYPSLLGATDEQGKLVVTVPACAFTTESQGSKPLLLVEAADFATRFVQLDGRNEVAMAPGARLRGRILGADGKPLVGLLLLLDSYAVVEAKDRGGFGHEPLPLRTDAEGCFEFWGLNDQGYRLLALPSHDDLRAAGLAVPAGRAVAPLWWIAAGKPADAKPVELGDVKLGALFLADVRVANHDKSPAPGARLLVKGGYGYNSPMVYDTDRKGRLLLTLPDGAFEIAGFVPGGGVAIADVTVASQDARPAARAVELVLSAPHDVTGSIVDGAGRPLAGASVMVWNRPRDVDHRLAEMAFQAHGPAQVVGADGRFTLAVPFGSASFCIHAWIMKDGKLRQAEEWVAVDENGCSDAVVIRIADR